MLTMGPNQAISVAMEAIVWARIAAVWSVTAAAGADVLATSYTLSQGIQKIGKFDLILCGNKPQTATPPKSVLKRRSFWALITRPTSRKLQKYPAGVSPYA